MPPTGFHGIIGILGGHFFNSDKEDAKWGFVVGSIFPDIDLLGSTMIYILTRSVDLTVGFHRTITHSILTLAFILLLGLIGIARQTTLFKINLEIGWFLFGFAVGGTIHVLMDFFYFDGVSILWPLIQERIYLIDSTYEDLTPLEAKLIASLDIGFESLYYLLVAFFVAKNAVDEELTINIGRYSLAIHNFSRKLTILAIYTILQTIVFLVIAVTFPLSRNDFVILLYIPGIFLIVFSCFLPIITRQTIQRLGREKKQIKESLEEIANSKD